MKQRYLQVISSDYFDDYLSGIPFSIDVAVDNLPDTKKFSYEDFEFYLIKSALYSAKIEGNTLDLNSFYRQRHSKLGRRYGEKDVKEVENIVDAYRFAMNNPLTQETFLKAHGITMKHKLPISIRGKYRKIPMGVWDDDGLVYQAMEWDLVPGRMDQLFHDIDLLMKRNLCNEQIFYYASMMHIWLAKIHPFNDGNGRSARLLEKWFIVSKLGRKAWSIISEKYYWDHRGEYYRKIALGLDYYHINWDKVMPFLLMLPSSLIPDTKN